MNKGRLASGTHQHLCEGGKNGTSLSANVWRPLNESDADVIMWDRVCPSITRRKRERVRGKQSSLIMATVNNSSQIGRVGDDGVVWSDGDQQNDRTKGGNDIGNESGNQVAVPCYEKEWNVLINLLHTLAQTDKGQVGHTKQKLAAWRWTLASRKITRAARWLQPLPRALKKIWNLFKDTSHWLELMKAMTHYLHVTTSTNPLSGQSPFVCV